MPKPRTVRLVEIAKILGVTKQRAHQIAEEKGFPASLAEDARGQSVEPVGGTAVGEAVVA